MPIENSGTLDRPARTSFFRTADIVEQNAHGQA